MPQAFQFAVRFLTRLPFGKHADYKPELAAAAVSWYGPVGVVIGSIIAISAWVLCGWLQLAALPAAALLLAIWVSITGALHLDGVGDCGDAWMGGHTPQHMLEIMKDSSCGAGAIVSIVLILVMKFSALVVLVEQGDWQLLIFAPVMARVVLTLVIRYTPYLRSDGLGASLQSNLDIRSISIVGSLLFLALSVLWLKGFIYAVIASFIAYLIIHQSLIRPLKGVTGDIYGAVVELTETAVLIGLVAAIY